MTALSERTVRVWTPPTSGRGYRSKRAAYVAWAKDLIFAACKCAADEDGMHECLRCRYLFSEPAWLCDACGTPDSDTMGRSCRTCYRGRCTVAGSIHGNARYLRLRDRLARWLRWSRCARADEVERGR